MANTSLANANYHLYEPSSIETSLAANVDNVHNPSAFPLLMMYRAQNQEAGQQYGQQLEQQRQDQMSLANQNYAAAMQKNAVDAAGHLGVAGAGEAMQPLFPNLNFAPGAAAANQRAVAGNVKDVGVGLGGAGNAGVTGLAPYAAQALPGANLQDGVNPRVAAAQVASSNRRDPYAATATGVDNQGNQISAPIPPGSNASAALSAAKGTPQFDGQAAINRLAIVNPSAFADIHATGVPPIFLPAPGGGIMVKGKSGSAYRLQYCPYLQMMAFPH